MNLPKGIRIHCYAIVFLLLFVGCKDPEKRTIAPRSDGLYVASFDGSKSAWYMYFSENEVVLGALSEGAPEQVASWITTSEFVYSAKYVFEDSLVKFTMPLSKGTMLQYVGKVTEKGLNTLLPSDFPDKSYFVKIDVTRRLR